VSPPTASGATDVPYPEGGEGDAIVVLELVVDRRGGVAAAHAVAGSAPFASAAERAARDWTFVPAMRDGSPVAARVRFELHFHAPRVVPNPPREVPVAPLATAAASSRPTFAPVQEVRVNGAHREPGSVRITRAEVREIAGAFNDPLRAIEILPGVAPVENGSPYYFIRGAPPGNSGYFVDGLRVPLLFHIGVGPSVIHPGLIDHVDFYPGAAPAGFGRFAGGIVNAVLTPPADHFRAEAELRVFDAGALVEAPYDRGQGTVLAAARYAYPGPILSAVSPSIGVGYWDYQSRATLHVTDRDQIGVLLFGSHDEFAKADDQTGALREVLASDFHRIDLRYDRALGALDHLRIATTLGWSSQGAQPVYVNDTMLGVRVEADARLSNSLAIRGGADVQVDDYGAEQGSPSSPGPPPPTDALPPPRNLSGGLHMDLVWHPISAVEVVSGVRLDGYRSTRSASPAMPGSTSGLVPAVDPRLAVRVRVAPAVAWLSSFGMAHEFPQLRVGTAPGDAVALPGFAAEKATLQTAVEGSEGLEAKLPGALTLTTAAFASTTYGMTDLTTPCAIDASGATPRYDCNDQTARGRAYGLELSLSRPLTEHLSANVSYTLSRTTREAPAPGSSRPIESLSPYDRTHVVSAAGAYDLGARWRAGARFTHYSGHPYSLAVDAPPDGQHRFAAFYRLDIRVEKRWRLGRDGSIAFVVEAQNVTLSRDGGNVHCTSGSNGTSCVVFPSGAVALPSVGVEAFF
jgi:hypothetical protein